MSYTGDKTAFRRILKNWPLNTVVTSPMILAIMKHHPAYKDGDTYTKRQGNASWSYYLEANPGKRYMGYQKALDAKWGKLPPTLLERSMGYFADLLKG